MSKPRAAKRTKSYAFESDDEESEEERVVARKKEPRAAAKRTKSYAFDSDDEEAEDAKVAGRKKTGKAIRFEDLDLSKRSTTTKVVADALLALLPKDATKQHSSAKALAKAFPLVVAELEARSNKAARKQVAGKSQPITFSFTEEGSDEVVATIDLPEDAFVHVLNFLDGYELVFASEVSKEWKSATRNPVLWEDGIDMRNLNNKKSFNMSEMLKLLKEPQFASVKAFSFPEKVKMGTSTMKQLAKALPYLERLDLTNSKAKDSDLIAATELFGNLQSLTVELYNVTSNGVASAVRSMGTQLLELRIIKGNRMSSQAVGAIASSCPNLKYFAYKGSCWGNSDDGVVGDDIVALVRSCRDLETLELHEPGKHILQSHYVEIAELVSNNLEEYALRNIFVNGSKRYENPFDIFDIHKVLKKYTFLTVRSDVSCYARVDLGRPFLYKATNRPKRPSVARNNRFFNLYSRFMEAEFEAYMESYPSDFDPDEL